MEQHMATISITRPTDTEVGSSPWQFSVGLGIAAVGVMALMVFFVISAVVSGWVSDQDPAQLGRILAYDSWLFPIATAAVAFIKIGIALILWGIVRQLWVRVETLKESLPALKASSGAAGS